MTDAEIIQITLNHWKMYYPKEYGKLGKERALAEATACASLTRSEMNAIKMVNPGMADEEAWAEARNLFCMTPPPEIHEEEPEQEEEPPREIPKDPAFFSSMWTPEQVAKADEWRAYRRELDRKRYGTAKKKRP